MRIKKSELAKTITLEMENSFPSGRRNRLSADILDYYAIMQKVLADKVLDPEYGSNNEIVQLVYC
jgi:hypothetical protein